MKIHDSLSPLAQQKLPGSDEDKPFYDHRLQQYQIPLRRPAANLVEDFRSSVAFRLSTVAEVISTGLAQVLSEQLKFVMLAGLNQISIPPSDGTFFDEEHQFAIRLLHHREKQSRWGLQLLPFKAFLPHQEIPASGVFSL